MKLSRNSNTLWHDIQARHPSARAIRTGQLDARLTEPDFLSFERSHI
jgi:hypothetical protein